MSVKKKNLKLSNLFKAAKSALATPKEADIGNWIGTGPSIRARARFAMLVAFVVAGPTLFISVQRSDDVSIYANSLVVYDQFWERVSEAQLSVAKTRASLWHLRSEPEIQNERRLKKDVRMLRMRLEEIVSARPEEFQTNFIGTIEELTRSLNSNFLQDESDKPSEEEESYYSVVSAMSSLNSLDEDLAELEREVAAVVYERRKNAIKAMSRVTRDQIMLLLLLLVSVPIFLIFVPAWIVSPLIRLKQIEHRIEEGRIRELFFAGKDEVSQLGRAIKEALMWREELDVRKSTKIFEIRNVLRAVIAGVNEPVFIIDRSGRVNYANRPASQILQMESHNLEGSGLFDHLFSSGLSEAVASSLSGDVPKEATSALVDFKDGRSVSVLARLSAVHDRAGTVSRVVIVLIPTPDQTLT